MQNRMKKLFKCLKCNKYSLRPICKCGNKNIIPHIEYENRKGKEFQENKQV